MLVRGRQEGTSGRDAAVAQDRVYLDGSALRRRRLAAAAPRQLVAALRRQRDRLSPAIPASDAPAPRVRRALAWMNGLLAVAALASSIIVAVLVADEGARSAWWQSDAPLAVTFLPAIVICSFVPAVMTLVFSSLSRRPRGAVVGGSSIAFVVALVVCEIWIDGLLPDDIAVAAVALLAVRLLTLAATVAVLLRPRRPEPVPWATFRRRNRAAFLAGAGFLIMAALSAMIGSMDAPTSGVPTLLGMFGGGSVLLAAAYFAGVRLIPLGVGATALTVCVVAFLNGDTSSVLLSVGPALLALAGFSWQLMRTAARPPVDFWETRWREWKWSLAVLAVAATVLVTWYFSAEWATTLAFGAVPATVALLSLADDLATDRFAGAVQRIRTRSPLHLD